MKKFIAYLLCLLISLFSTGQMYTPTPVLASEEAGQTGQAGQAPPDIILYRRISKTGIWQYRTLIWQTASLDSRWQPDYRTAGSYDSKAVRMNAGRASYQPRL